MNSTRSSVGASWFFFVAVCVALLTSVVPSLALERGQGGYFHTGDSIRKKSVVISVDVYAIGHDMKELPPTKSKQAVIDMDTGKRFTWQMKRDVSADKIRTALREAYAMNGYGDAAKIGQFLGVFNADLKDKQFVIITYDSDKKTTTLQVQGGGTTTVGGVDFMKATWSIWFGKIDQPSLGDELISKI